MNNYFVKNYSKLIKVMDFFLNMSFQFHSNVTTFSKYKPFVSKLLNYKTYNCFKYLKYKISGKIELKFGFGDVNVGK